MQVAAFVHAEAGDLVGMDNMQGERMRQARFTNCFKEGGLDSTTSGEIEDVGKYECAKV